MKAIFFLHGWWRTS
ncbi:trp operon leader peptide [Citrobacter freundii]|nr:trp operon leader peptide [Citrobacter freundii]MCR3692259.1 trp operon leader peptide [Citrobacter freundii]